MEHLIDGNETHIYQLSFEFFRVCMLLKGAVKWCGLIQDDKKHQVFFPRLPTLLHKGVFSHSKSKNERKLRIKYCISIVFY